MDPCTVLIVDDEPHIRFMLQLKFQAAGYDVMVASEGQQALDLAMKRAPDLVVSDFQMPGTDGLQMCRELAAAPSTARVPVILLTARGHRLPERDRVSTNIRRVFDKPFSTLELLRCAEELIRTGTTPLRSGRPGRPDRSEADAA